MYEQFYGLKRKPFSLVPDPDFLYLSKKHAVALALLEYGLQNQAGFSLITGEIGSGKTTLIRHLLKNMDQQFTVGVITNTHRSFGDLLTWVLTSFGLELGARDKVVMYQQMIDFVAQQHVAGHRVVLIVDEAQNMDIETLEELRLLSNVNVGEQLLLQLILVGQPELGQTLARPELSQFAQRISVEHHIPALDFPETRSYIEHRLQVAGATAEIFDRYACAAVYYYSRGIPRAINNICDMALVYGYAEEVKPVTCEIVLEVVRTKPIIRDLAGRRPRTEEDDRLRDMVREIKGIDIAVLN
jgi:type II secretory pathway predicted ATPase ExeA